jgi:hypothetical protein
MRSYSAGEAGGLSGRGSSFGARSRRTPEIPKLVVYHDGSHFFRRKGNFLEAAHFNDVAFAGYNLIEFSTVPQLYRCHLVTYACLSGSLQVVDKTAGYWH